MASMRLRLLGMFVLATCAGSCDASRNAQSVSAQLADSTHADSLARARQDSINRAQPGYVVDSVLPVAEQLRRFRLALGGTPVTELEHASSSREALVRRLVRAVAAQDTADLRAMVLSAREFSDLVYPASPYTHPPYRQAPGLVWMQIANPSVSGFRRLTRRRGGIQYRYVDHSCEPKPEVQGKNRLWTGCTLRVVNPEGVATTERWFGSIIERDGRFEFVSYSNQF